MSSISLRQYCEEIKGLIRQGALDEAVAVGRHILSFYPKYISPYRLMGEAALERENYDEAADLFRRVLGADPEDVVSHVALAVVHDEARALDEAIWHLEIAFELAPGNAEIRQELIRLYTERDGSPPQRLKLTPAALGRLYLAEGLYDRAVAELEPLLQAESDRLDLSLAVAEALWRQDRRWEASEYYQQVLADLPYSLKANLIQGALLLQGGRPDEARPHLERARALDPENMLAGRLFGEHSPLRPEPVQIARLGEVGAPAPPPLEVPTPIAPEMPAIEPEPSIPEPAIFPEGRDDREPSLEGPAETPVPDLPAIETEMEPAVSESETEPPPPEPAPALAEPEPVLQDEPTWLVSLEQKAQSQTSPGQVTEGVPDWLLGLRGLSRETEPGSPAETTEEVAEPEPTEAAEEWSPVTDAEIAHLDAEPSEPEPPAEPLPAWPSRAPDEEPPVEEPPAAEPDISIPEMDAEPPPAPEAVEPGPPAWPTPSEPPTPTAEEPASAPRSLSQPEDDLGKKGPTPVTDAEPDLFWPTGPEAAAQAPTEDAEDEVTSPTSAPDETAPPPAPEVPVAEPIPPEISGEPEAIAAPEEPAPSEPSPPQAPIEPVSEVTPAEPPQVPRPEGASAETVEETPLDIDSLLQVARDYLERGDLDASVEHYHRLVHGSSGVPAEAMEDLEDLMERAPDQLEIQQLLGDAYMRAGRLQEALRLYREIRTQLIPG
ncbi:MAG: tetratricopeptide repeat protein [Anaerolineae bacterium]